VPQRLQGRQWAAELLAGAGLLQRHVEALLQGAQVIGRRGWKPRSWRSFIRAGLARTTTSAITEELRLGNGRFQAVLIDSDLPGAPVTKTSCRPAVAVIGPEPAAPDEPTVADPDDG